MCERAQWPWDAHPDLKSSWMDGLRSSDPVERLASGVGLTRAARLTSAEMDALDGLMRDNEALDVLPSEALLILMVTGASPPPSLWEMFFAPTLARVPEGTPALWLTLAWWLRHPANAETARSILDRAPSMWRTPQGRFLVLASLLNPLLPPPARLYNTWLQAEAAFHPRASKEPAALLDPLLIAAWTLRWDRLGVRPRPFPSVEWLARARQALGDMPVPVEHLHRPDAGTITKFQGTDPIRTLWRFYLPLLDWPWSEPPIARPINSAMGVAMIIAGFPPTKQVALAVDSDPETGRLLREHPVRGLLFP